MRTDDLGVDVPEPVAVIGWTVEHGWTCEWWDHADYHFEEHLPTSQERTKTTAHVAAWLLANFERVRGNYERQVAHEQEAAGRPQLF